MGETNIRQSLAKLQEHLQKTSPNDEEGRAILNALNENIETLLTQPDPLRASNVQGLGDRLATAIHHFEATHPNLMNLLNRVALMLSDGGL
jgi:hypothetical protein